MYSKRNNPEAASDDRGPIPIKISKTGGFSVDPGEVLIRSISMLEKMEELNGHGMFRRFPKKKPPPEQSD